MREEREMVILETVNEIATQITTEILGCVAVSITDVIGSVLVRLVLFFVNLLLGL